MADLHASDVRASFDYLRDPPTDDPTLELKYYTEDRSKTTMRTVPVEMPITDGRPRAGDYSLDREGFALVPHHSSVTNFLNREATDSTYTDEMGALICDVTGAYFALAVGVNVRFVRRRDDYMRTNDDQPARFPHADFTDESSRSLIEIIGAGAGDYSRAAIYNVWRVFSDPPQDFPLAVCDARSVTAADEKAALAVLDLPGEDEPFSSVTTVYHQNPANRWVYFSDMTVHEALIFKAFDTDEHRPQRVPHSSFANPLVPPGTPPRCSIEARVIAFYK
jgi:hypothetical protein